MLFSLLLLCLFGMVISLNISKILLYILIIINYFSYITKKMLYLILENGVSEKDFRYFYGKNLDYRFFDVDLVDLSVKDKIFCYKSLFPDDLCSILYFCYNELTMGPLRGFIEKDSQIMINIEYKLKDKHNNLMFFIDFNFATDNIQEYYFDNKVTSLQEAQLKSDLHKHIMNSNLYEVTYSIVIY